MSYTKKYLPENSDIKVEWDEREDRIKAGFDNVVTNSVSTASVSKLAGAESLESATVKKVGNIVYMDGRANSASSTGFPINSYTSIAQIPYGYRPQQTVRSGTFGTGGSPTAITVDAGGLVRTNHQSPGRIDWVGLSTSWITNE